MKVLAVAAGLALASIGAQAKPSGEEFVSEDGRFKVWYPGKPTYERKDDGDGDPNRESRKYRVTIGEDKDLLVNFHDEPEAPDVDALFKRVKQAYLDKKWKVLKEGKISLGAHKGFSFTILTTDDLIIQMRHYFAKNRWYMLMVSTTKAHTGDADVKKFLDSFRILEEKK